VRFWDSSAIVPLLLEDSARKDLLELLERDPSMLVWWGTPVECASAIARRQREGALALEEAGAALARLQSLSKAWAEIAATKPVRDAAQRLLRVHPLRAADSLQLAAAIVASEGDPASLPFVSLDERLNEAASREGFPGAYD
jgi:predicted nucleic acid-binding protein